MLQAFIRATSMEFISFLLFHIHIALYTYCSDGVLLLQWTSAAPLAGGVVLQHSCRGEVVPPVVVPAQSRVGADQVWAQVGNHLLHFIKTLKLLKIKKKTQKWWIWDISNRSSTDRFPSSRPSRVLSKFAFSLSQDCELPDKKEVSPDRLQRASSALRPERWNSSRL